MGEPSNALGPAEVEAIVRAYLARMGRRYAPLIGALLVLVLLATLVPSRSQQAATVAGPQADNGAAAAQGDTTTSGTSGPTARGASVATGSASGTGGSSLPAAITPPAAAGSKGIARSGVACAPHVRQVKWTVYAPLCVPTYTGNNGGTSYRGVTRNKIVAFYRYDRSAEDTAVNAALGSANLDDGKYIADLQTYIKFFNKQFELYGRQVQLFEFTGQGDYLQEDQGLDQGQAQADAQTAYDNNGFIDATFPLKGSYPFWQAIADRKMITLDPVGFPQSWYVERQPYWYSALPTGTGTADWVTNMVCRRMAGMHANFAGDTTYQLKNRVFGLVHPDNPEYKDIGAYIRGNLKKCGVDLSNKEISYTINVATMGNQSTSVAAQLKAQGVSTVLCYCDPIFPLFLTGSANGQQYNPEWWMPGWGDAQGQDMAQESSEWHHAVVIGGKYPSKKQDEAYQVYKLANPAGQPQSPYYAVAYGVLLLMYDALQAAGPNLNPTTFQRGWFSLGSISGPAGTLEWAPQHYSPIVSAPMAWFDYGATSNFNGNTGAYENCEGGKFYPFALSKAAEWGSGQVACFK